MLRSLCLLSLLFVFVGCRTSIGTVVRKYGYTELRPATTLSPPGTLARVTSTKPMQIRLVCAPSVAFGNDLKVANSDAATTEITQALNRGLKLEADYVKQIQANAAYKDVSNVAVSFTNVKVIEVPDSEVYRNVKFRSHDCEQARADHEAAGRQVTMVRSVVQADVNYFVSFKRELSAEVKGDITKQLAATLGVAASETTDALIKGKGLYWGLIEDPRMADVKSGLSPTGGRLDRPRLLGAVTITVLPDDSSE